MSVDQIQIQNPIIVADSALKDAASGVVHQITSPFETIADLGSDVFDSAAGLYRRLRAHEGFAPQQAKWDNDHLWIGLNPLL